MNITWKKISAATAVAVAALAGAPTDASAHNGMIPHCTGAIKCGMGGAGVAVPTDATNAIVNPALMARVGNQVSINMGWFHTNRTLDLSGTTHAATNKVNHGESQLKDYADGALGVNYMINDQWSIGLSIAPGGGGEVKYDQSRMAIGGGANGFDSSVRIRMINAAPTVSWAPSDNQAYGFSVVLGHQDFKSNMVTSANVQTKGHNALETVYGHGFKIGGMWTLSDALDIGASYQTKIHYGRLRRYDDIFIGAIDAPATLWLGGAAHVTDATTVAFDYKKLHWADINAISTAPQAGGFGWDNQDIYMLGVQHTYNDSLAVRAGWNYGAAPFEGHKAFANALFPAINEHHFTAGLSFNVTDSIELVGSAYYSPKNKLVDPGKSRVDAYSGYGAGAEITHEQYGAMVGLNWNF